MDPSLDEKLNRLASAITSFDTTESARLKIEIARANWPLVTVLDRIANAELTAGEFSSAKAKFALLESFVPENRVFFLRRVAAAILGGDEAAIQELLACDASITSDDEIFNVTQQLIDLGLLQEARIFINNCITRQKFSADIIAACRARVLSASGQSGRALDVLQSVLETEKPNITALRLNYLISEHFLRHDAARDGAMRTAMIWGEERELRYASDLMMDFYDFGRCAEFLHAFSKNYPHHAEIIHGIEASLNAGQEALAAAVAAHGAPSFDDRARLERALASAGIERDEIVWGRRSLILLLRSGAMTERDFEVFGLYLPNWEKGRIKNYVLYHALQSNPESDVIRLNWLRRLVQDHAYGDAVAYCLKLASGTVSDELLFFQIMLLRLHQLAIVPPFMESVDFERLRRSLLDIQRAASIEFRCVMHTQLVALGAPDEPWPKEAASNDNSPQAAEFRRSFAISTGRLQRSSAIKTESKSTSPIRPVVAISGQLRGFETVWESIAQHLVLPLDAPVVLTVWDKTSNAQGRHAQRLERVLPPAVLSVLKPEERFTDTFEATYPETFRLLFGETDVSATVLGNLVTASGTRTLAVETESQDFIDALFPPHLSRNMLKMYYKLARADHLIAAAEYSSGELFSHVIWTRPDCGITSLAKRNLLACMQQSDIAYSSWVTDTSFGDYTMIVPRRAFAEIGKVFSRIANAGDSYLFPWRPPREGTHSAPYHRAAFGGPDLLYDVLLTTGHFPLAKIPAMTWRLVGRTPPATQILDIFGKESARRDHGRDDIIPT